MLHKHLTLNCNGQLFMLDKPVVMGILNVTPDSFYDGGRYNLSVDRALARAEQIIGDGGHIIDVGGMSSRPGADFISQEEELDRVIPVIQAIASHFPKTIISIDTFRAKVVEEAISAGASIINDISAWSLDEAMLDAVLKAHVPYILMHMQGIPRTMQVNPTYGQVAVDVLDFLIEKVTQLRKAGLVDIIVDPGFGFGKTLDQNYELLTHLHTLKILESPIMVGLSRKSMIYKLLDIDPNDSLTATSVLHYEALNQGAQLLRVHDVKEAVQTIALWEKCQKE